MLSALALVTVVMAGLGLLTLAAVSFCRPERARSFLLGFAESPTKHYLELGVRVAVGSAFLLHAPRAPFPEAFTLLGWILIATTVGLLLLPWHVHRRFARWAVPHALQRPAFIGTSSLVFGTLVIACALYGDAT